MRLSDVDVLNPDLYNGRLPHDQYALLREQAPCHRQRIASPGMIDQAWVVTRYADVRQISRNAEDFLNYQGVSLRSSGLTGKDHGHPAMISLDGAEHDRSRRIVNRLFTRRAVAAFEASFRALAVTIIERAIAVPEFDFVTAIAVEMPMQVICDLVGVPAEDRPQLLRWSNTIATPLDADLSPSPEAVAAALQGIWQYGLELAQDRRRDPGSDIMTQLGAATIEGDQLSDEELMGFTLLLIGAGNETTRMAIAHGLQALMEYPEQLAWLRQQLDLMPDTAVEEILRYTTPVVLLRRTAARDLELHGCHLTAGDALTLVYGSANFDPEQFPDPHAFDLRRDPNDHLTFGYGKHVCLGAYVARLEIRILFEEFLRRVRSVEPNGAPAFGRDFLFRPIKHLPVKVAIA
jgi:cholest-4-en-3-one 26-monooxygenase